jgi:hypothetical protein
MALWCLHAHTVVTLKTYIVLWSFLERPVCSRSEKTDTVYLSVLLWALTSQCDFKLNSAPYKQHLRASTGSHEIINTHTHTHTHRKRERERDIHTWRREEGKRERCVYVCTYTFVHIHRILVFVTVLWEIDSEIYSLLLNSSFIQLSPLLIWAVNRWS